MDASERIAGTWFVWLGWLKARRSVIELVADFIVSTSLWLLYASLARVAHVLISDPRVLLIADAIHTCAAVMSFALVSGLGLVHLLRETDPGRL
jgi:hypothetical protein